jgi:hypothetical protein
MKTYIKIFIMLALLVGAINLRAQGTAFTYQGRLTDGTNAANGSYDLTFSLFSVSSGAGQVGSTYPSPATAVSNGLFIVALDFGANFPGANRWLEIGVRTNGSAAAYSILSPRQAVTPSPYAIFATASGTASNVVNGSVVKSLNGLTDLVTLAAGSNVTITPSGNTLTLAGLGGSGIWSVNGNDAYYNAGNVGIGTTTPVAQLQAETGEVKPAVYGHATGAGTGVQGDSSTGIGVYASSTSGNGVYATSTFASGVEGHSGTGNGVYASSIVGRGVYASSDSGNGVESHSTSGRGVFGQSSTGAGVEGASTDGFGVYGSSTSASGVEGHSTGGFGVYGISAGNDGVHGVSTSLTGVAGISTSGFGVYGISTSADGVQGHSSSGSGVYGGSTSGFGVFGYSSGGGLGVLGEATGQDGVRGITHGVGANAGVHGIAPIVNEWAGYFDGDVGISTDLLVTGSKHFKIDHPLDPANKYLLHASIESPDVKNLYDGNVTTDASGEAIVTLPTYFEALNRDFRYQLTAIGQFAQAIVSSEIKDNQFAIKTDKPNVKVSWQVTGIRQDAYMKAHPMVVEQDKPANERGTYQHPELFGQPEEKGLSWSQNPELWKRLKKERVEQAALPKP